MLCVATLGASVLGALPAAALEPTWLSVRSWDPLLNENGDAYWESATITVYTDADAAHWELATNGQAVADGDLSADQLSVADNGYGVDVPVSSATMGVTLVAGTYTFTVTATKDGEEPSTRSADLHVSTAPALPPLVPSAAVLYPLDEYPGVAHGVTFRHGLDATLAELSSARYEVVGADGPLGNWAVEPGDHLLRWDGTYYPPEGGGSPSVAPAGTYQVRLVVDDDRGRRSGPLSGPFRLSRGYRSLAERGTSRTANATRTATLTKRLARLRVVDGSLRYRALNNNWRPSALVRTAHRVAVSRNRVAGQPVVLVVRGRWQDDMDIDLEIVTPRGRVRNIDVYWSVSRRALVLPIPTRWIRTNGTVRFRLLWTSHGTTGSAGRVGRTDSVGVRVTRYVWRY